MPAKSKAQQRFMAMVEHDPTASPEVAKAAGSMTKGQARDFAATKSRGLPEHVKHKRSGGRSAKPRGGIPY